MLNENLFDKRKTEDDRFIRYRPIKPTVIFGNTIEPSDCIIYLSKELTWMEASPILEQYLDWLATCKSELLDCFSQKLGEDLPKEWYETIELYSIDITFLSLNNFGATVCFGESLFPDHSIELDFDKYEIENVSLNG